MASHGATRGAERPHPTPPPGLRVPHHHFVFTPLQRSSFSTGISGFYSISLQGWEEEGNASPKVGRLQPAPTALSSGTPDTVSSQQQQRGGEAAPQGVLEALVLQG